MSGKEFSYLINASPKSEATFVSSLTSTEEYTEHPITDFSASTPQFYMLFDSNVPGMHTVALSFSPMEHTDSSNIRIPYSVEVLDVDTFQTVMLFSFGDSDTADKGDTLNLDVENDERYLKRYSFLYDFGDVDIQNTYAAGKYVSTVTVIVDGN